MNNQFDPFWEEKTKDDQLSPRQKVDAIFADFEARNNFVGVFEVLLKVDKRLNPQNYD